MQRTGQSGAFEAPRRDGDGRGVDEVPEHDERGRAQREDRAAVLGWEGRRRGRDEEPPALPRAIRGVAERFEPLDLGLGIAITDEPAGTRLIAACFS